MEPSRLVSNTRLNSAAALDYAVLNWIRLRVRAKNRPKSPRYRSDVESTTLKKFLCALLAVQLVSCYPQRERRAGEAEPGPIDLGGADLRAHLRRGDGLIDESETCRVNGVESYAYLP